MWSPTIVLTRPALAYLRRSDGMRSVQVCMAAAIEEGKVGYLYGGIGARRWGQFSQVSEGEGGDMHNMGLLNDSEFIKACIPRCKHVAALQVTMCPGAMLHPGVRLQHIHARRAVPPTTVAIPRIHHQAHPQPQQDAFAWSRVHSDLQIPKVKSRAHARSTHRSNEWIALDAIRASRGNKDKVHEA